MDDEVPDGQQRQPRRRLARKDPHLGHISNAALRVRFPWFFIHLHPPGSISAASSQSALTGQTLLMLQPPTLPPGSVLSAAQLAAELSPCLPLPAAGGAGDLR